MGILNKISEQLQIGKAKLVKELVQQAVDAGIPAGEILTEGLLAGMSMVGERFKNNEIFVPEVLVAARAMNMGAALLKPLLADAGIKASGRVCIGTVKGDLHDIGKNLVALMMKSVNLKVIDLGANVSAEKFVEAINEYHPDIVGLSALLTTTMNEQGHVIEVLKEAGVRDQVKVMIGGAPVTQGWADKIGADAFTADAAEASRWAKTYCTSIR